MKKETALLAIVAAALVAFGVGHYTSETKSAAGAAAEKAGAAPVKVKAGGAAASAVPKSIPSKGKEDAAVTIIEISDFQCPFCSRVGPTLKKIAKNYPNDVRILWSNNALSFHDRAKPAAIASLAAHRQGKFWEMHDKMFANQRSLTDDNFKKWAKELGLDVAQFETDLKDPALARQVDREQAAANASGARGTPGFFINGKLLSGAQPYEAFKSAVDEALASAKKHKDAGKTGAALMEAAWAEHGSDTGTNVYKWFIKGEKPVAPKREERREAAAEPDAPAQAPPESREIWKAVINPKTDAILGNSDEALVTIVEFSDFECPFCSRGGNTVKAVKNEYGDKVRVVFKHHPLPFHRNAGPAHKAAIAAQKQGKFWEFHDKAFENQRGLNEDNFVAWAKELGLDVDKFNKDRKDASADARIKADMEMAATIKVQGTPNFLINGRKVVGAQPKGVFKAVIDEEIKKANDAGMKGDAWYNKIVAEGKVFTELDGKENKWDLSKLPFKGPKRAKIVVTEFSDFQCPYCSRVGTPVMEAMKRFKGKVKVVFAHFPLRFHKEAKPASVMAQEAFEQGGSDLFWKVHDDLFARQRELSEAVIKEIAKKHGVKWANVEKNRERHEKLIADTMATGNKAGVQGTPSVYINGRKYEPGAGFSADAFAGTFKKLLAGKL